MSGLHAPGGPRFLASAQASVDGLLQTVLPTFGPDSGDVAMTTATGQVLLTSSSRQILEAVNVEGNPIARLVLNSLLAFADEHGALTTRCEHSVNAV